MSTDNITFRKLKKSTSNIDITNCINLDSTIRSLYDCSLDDSNISTDYKIQMEQLRSELDSAHAEIENLNVENRLLKETIEKYRRLQTYISTPKTSRKSIIRGKNMLFNSKIEISSGNALMKTPVNGNTIAKYQTTALPQRTQIDNTENICTGSDPGKVNIDTKISNGEVNKVIILADEYGRGIQRTLQQLLGPSFDVFSMFKPGAKTKDVLNGMTKEIASLTSKDYVVVITGSNDNSPLEYSAMLYHWLQNTRDINVLMTMVPHNRYLNENKLNDKLRLICQNFENSQYIDVNYRFNTHTSLRELFTTNVTGLILRHILRCEYRIKYRKYTCHNGKAKKQTDTGKVYKTGLGTIPYYFNKMEKAKGWELSQQIIKKTCENGPRKITYYFRKMEKPKLGKNLIGSDKGLKIQ